jgi:hypothetical protein
MCMYSKATVSGMNTSSMFIGSSSRRLCIGLLMLDGF